MKVIAIKTVQNFEDIQVVEFQRFWDNRGYFTETYRKSDEFFSTVLDLPVVQINESFSHEDVFRGLHFQWNPYMGKLIRTIRGHMIDIFLDIRMGSPTLGHIGMYSMPSDSAWIWVPPGFAHGNFFLAPTTIEYLCTGEYSPNCEMCITPYSLAIIWDSCDAALKKLFELTPLKISDKDKVGMTLENWIDDPRSSNFIYQEGEKWNLKKLES